MAECSTCSAWRGTGGGKGLCRAHPPAVLFGAHFGQAGSGVPEVSYLFPITVTTDWCREYALKGVEAVEAELTS